MGLGDLGQGVRVGHARGEHAPVHQGHELREALPVRVDLDSGDADAAPGGGHRVGPGCDVGAAVPYRGQGGGAERRRVESGVGPDAVQGRHCLVGAQFPQQRRVGGAGQGDDAQPRVAGRMDGVAPDPAHPGAGRPGDADRHTVRPRAGGHALTPLGASLATLFSAVKEWAEEHIEEVVKARERYETEAGAGAVAGAQSP